MASFWVFLLELWEPLRLVLRFVIELAALTGVIYLSLLYLRGTRAAPVLLGIVIITLVGYFLAQLFGLEVFEWLLEKVPALLALGILIIFQPELRRVLADIGSNPRRLLRTEENVEETIEALIGACFHLAGRRHGALIAIEQDIGMRAYAEAGVAVNAPISAELLATIFYKDTPLHDGAVIIKDGVILAASCLMPLTEASLSRELGTRHRAGVGVTEQTDAIALIVSEERGTVNIAHKGRLVRDVDEGRLRRHLTNFLIKRRERTTTTGTQVKAGMATLRTAVMKLPDANTGAET